jgi:hypothetical protein
VKDRLIDLFGDGEPINIEIGPNGELPPGVELVPFDPNQTFREFMAENGKDFPDPDDSPATWAAWFADAR